MGAAVGADEKGSVNVELNIVPFIDLMSCLTAFLLVTAVWVNLAQINIQPKGKSRDVSTVIDEQDKPNLSVLIQADQIWVGLSRVGESETVQKTGEGKHDFPALTKILEKHKASAYFADRADIEIAAESTESGKVTYQDVISAMDSALKAKFSAVGLSDPMGLSARPTAM